MPLLSNKIKEGGFAKAATGSGGGNYLNPSSIADGEKVRITFLGDDSIDGYECWVDGPEGKRLALRFADEPTSSDIEERAAELGGKVTDDTVAKRFMAFAVWNFELEKIQVFQFTQQSLATPLINYLSDEEIETEPHLYDFVISKTKVGPMPIDVRYGVSAMPGRRRKDNFDKQITAAWDKAKEAGFDLQVLLAGGDPFKGLGF